MSPQQSLAAMPPAEPPVLKIGDVAIATGLSVRTIRYYENIQLLSPSVQRSAAGYRLFTHDTLKRLAFIKRAQGLGLSLDEIRQILAVHDRGELPCDDVKRYLADKIEAIAQQISELETLRNELSNVLEDWQDISTQNHATDTICPNLQPK